ncbi:hypothetical protein HGRIS_012771 [Hohenbuehelia grisea]|uniref:Anaphase-promoting complex subunit 15 n=1 Tax=Hohenbuehelia grisea TaxID=104357 RepID=A0ABR3ITE6_9AGAR
MTAATPTLIPRDSIFPRLLPRAPQPHPIPIPHRNKYSHFNAFRDLQREMDDLSEEENELEDATMAVHSRGYNWLIPIGRYFTQQEERNDADEDSEDSGTAQSGGAPSIMEDEGENDSAPDLDASMEDMDDEEGDEEETGDEMGDDDTGDFEEPPSASDDFEWAAV